jgi:pimeloyl-[acyl-carrier protein] methyl ester esterase
MAYLRVEDSKQIYYEHFAGVGVPIVLVHGWAVDSRCWDGVLPALFATGRPVITLDHRCCGRSDRDFTDVSVKAIAADVVRLVDHLRLQRVVLNGWSLGGAVVVEAAVVLGARLAGLVLTGAATPRYTRSADFEYGGTAADVEGTIAAIQADRAGTFEGVARAVFARQPGAAPLAFVARMFVDSSPRAYATLLDLAPLEQRGLLPKINAPALLLHGADDAFVPLDVARAAAALLPDARLSIYPNCGHAPFLEEQARYCQELTAFLQQF